MTETNAGKSLEELEFTPSEYVGVPVDKQPHRILSWISDVLVALKKSTNGDPTALTVSQQRFVTEELQKLLEFIHGNKEGKADLNTKAIRNGIAKTYMNIYSNSSNANIYNVSQLLLGYINSGKSEKKSYEMKQISAVALGSLYQASGLELSAVGPLAAISLNKLIKDSPQSAGYRYSLLSSLQQVTASVGDTFDESLTKDLWKTARNLTSEKSAKVSSAAFGVLYSLISVKPVFRGHSDLEQLRSLCFKAYARPHTILRTSSSKVLARALNYLVQLNTASAGSPKKTKSKKKSKKLKEGEEDENDDNDDDTNGSRAGASHASATANGNGSKKGTVIYSLAFDDAFKTLTHMYTRPGQTARIRAAVIETIGEFILSFEHGSIDGKYSFIARTLFEMVSELDAKNDNGHSAIAARSHCKIILNDLIAHRMGEFGQLNALRIIISILGSPENLNEYSIAAALIVLEELLGMLGPAISAELDPLKIALLGLIGNDSEMVRVHANVCLRAFVSKLPSQLNDLLNLGLNTISESLNSFKEKSFNPSKLLGHADMVALLSKLTEDYSQYSSLSITSRILSTAKSLLKGTGSVYLVALQATVGWRLLSGLMALGPSFVKVQMSQLMLIWKSVLSKISGKGYFDKKGALEVCYLLHVRNGALSCVLAFLNHNSKLVTSDVGRRIGSMIQNASAFVAAIPLKLLNDSDPANQLNGLFVIEMHSLVERRILQCYFSLSKKVHTVDTFAASALTAALATIADVERKGSPKLSTIIAAATGAIGSIWESADNDAYGLTSKVYGYDIVELKNDSKDKSAEIHESHWLTKRGDWISDIELLITKPILEAYEFDFDSLLSEGLEELRPVPVLTAIVDCSIDIFTILFPLQPSKVQESLLDQLQSFNASSELQNPRKAGRKLAVTINTAVSLHSVLNYAVSGTTSSNSAAKNIIKTSRVVKTFRELNKKALVDSEASIRNIASQTIGMLCSIAGSSTSSECIKSFIDEIVANTDPNARSGCSLALGYILQHVGGMFANLHLKTVLGVLISLSNDPHPLVHFYALEAICVTITGSGLGFSNFAGSTLATLSKLFLLESHSDEPANSTSSNLDVEFPTTRVIARCVKSIINTLGPDLQTNQKALDYVLVLLQQFEISDDTYVVGEAYRSLQELLIFTPGSVNELAFAKKLHRNLLLPLDKASLRKTSIDALCQLMRIQSTKIFKLAGEGLKLDIWSAYDYNPFDAELRQFITTWLEETGEETPLEWITIVQSVLLKSKQAFNPSFSHETSSTDESNTSMSNPDVDFGDEEGASFAGSAGAGNTNSMGGQGDGSEENQNDVSSVGEPLKWQTRALAISVLKRLIEIQMTGKPLEERESNTLVSKVGDIVKVAFFASTSSVLELRLLGLKLMNEVLNSFRDITDPDFTEVALLEQYQAQISSALTPAFSADSSPDLAFEAIHVSATFIGSGIIKNVSRMGRILKLLTSALNSCSEAQFSLGELKIPSPNAQIMLKVAVLSLWANLQVYSMQPGGDYLEDVITPQISVLVPLWISALRDFAKLRFEPEQSVGIRGSGDSSSGAVAGGNTLDQMYKSLSRTGVLPSYQQSWLQLVDAIASLIERDSELVFSILDEREKQTHQTSEEDIKYSNEPAAFFFVLFGLCFEALIRPQHAKESSTDFRLKVLNAMKRILNPSVSGNAIYKDAVFVELVDVFDRIILTGSISEQRVVVAIAHNLCVNHPGGASAEKAHEDDSNDSESQEEHISESVDQLFELLRVVMLALKNVFPALSDTDDPSTPIFQNRRLSRRDEDSEKATRTKTAFDMIKAFPSIIRVDLYACLLYVFEKLLDDDNSQGSVIPSVLVSLKELLRLMVASYERSAENRETIDLQLYTAVNQVLNMLRERKGDTSETGILKQKNCLLSLVLIITACGKLTKLHLSSLVGEFCDIILESFNNSTLAPVAAECIKTLLIATSEVPLGKVVTEKTLPSLIAMTTGGSTLSNGEDGFALTKHTYDILVGYTRGLKVGSDHKRVALSLTMPCLLYLLLDKSPSKRAYVRDKLLLLAGDDADSFKYVVLNVLTDSQKMSVQSVLQDNGSGDESLHKGGDDTDEQSKDHIQLKSFV